MPNIKIEITKQSEEKKRELVKELTRVASDVTGIREDAFVIFVNEYEAESIGVGGQLLSDKLRKGSN